MSEVFEALNAALKKLPWWKKLILVFLYPVIWVVTWLTWRAAEKLKKSQEGDKGIEG